MLALWFHCTYLGETHFLKQVRRIRISSSFLLWNEVALKITSQNGPIRPLLSTQQASLARHSLYHVLAQHP